jgi:hypothetical protein
MAQSLGQSTHWRQKLFKHKYPQNRIVYTWFMSLFNDSFSTEKVIQRRMDVNYELVTRKVTVAACFKVLFLYLSGRARCDV